MSILIPNTVGRGPFSYVNSSIAGSTVHNTRVDDLISEPGTRPARVDLPYPFVMTTVRPIHAPTTSYASLSSNSDLPTSREGQPIASDETSPLLIPRHAYVHQPTISGSWCSALSSFFDDNAGLLLVAASQIFYSAMSMSVKVLNSLDEPVPTLEVCRPRTGIYPLS